MNLPRSRRGRVRGAGALAGGALLVAGSVAVIATGGGDAAGAEESVATGTAQVQRQDLVETESADGTLGYSDERMVMSPQSGTITWLPEVGSTVRPNHRLFEVDGEAVYLLDGAKPAWRTLKPGLRGDDVRQLERNLRELGKDPGKDMRVDGDWDSGTTAAVERWQEAKGLERTGEIALGRVVFQPGARRVASTEVTLGGAPSGGGDSAGRAPDSSGDAPASATTMLASYRPDDAASQSRLVDDAPPEEPPVGEEPEPEPTPTPTPSPEPERPADPPPATASQAPSPSPTPTPSPTPAPTQTPKQTRPSTPNQTQQPQQRPQRSQPRQQAPSAGRQAPSGGRQQPGAAAPGGGDQPAVASPEIEGTAANPVAIMTTTSGRRIVTVDLETSKAELARKGRRVDVELPSGDHVDGRIESVGKVATLPDTEDPSASEATIEVTIRFAGRGEASGLDQAPVDVDFERSRRRDVLAVPVTALMARSGGRFAVEVHEGDRRRIVPVQPGLYTSGYVEIEGEGLREGMTVTNAEL